jgi:hypothetical protein
MENENLTNYNNNLKRIHSGTISRPLHIDVQKGWNTFGFDNEKSHISFPISLFFSNNKN